jgi:hypothetical protein
MNKRLIAETQSGVTKRYDENLCRSWPLSEETNRMLIRPRGIAPPTNRANVQNHADEIGEAEIWIDVHRIANAPPIPRNGA